MKTTIASKTFGFEKPRPRSVCISASLILAACILVRATIASPAKSESSLADTPHNPGLAQIDLEEQPPTRSPGTYFVKRAVRELQTKVVNFAVTRPVREQHSKQVTYTETRVVREQHKKIDPISGAEIIYDVTKCVPVQCEQTVDYVVLKMVTEQEPRTIQYFTTRYETEELDR